MLGENFFDQNSFLLEVDKELGGKDDEEGAHSTNKDGLQVGDACTACHHTGQPSQDPVDAQHNVRLA